MERKLKVLQVHNYYKIAGGEDQVVRNEKKLLEEYGHRVYRYSRHNRELEQMGMVRKLLLPFTTVFSLRTFREVKKIIRDKRIDIVHVHNTLPLISPSVFYAAFARKVPVVMTVHNFRLLCPGAAFYRAGKVCEECIAKSGKGLLCSLKYGCYRNSRLQTLVCVLSMQFHRMLGTYKRVHFICLTEFNKEKLLKWKQISDRQIFVKANYMNRNGEIVNATQREAYFLYAGRLEEEKGVKVLLEAFHILQERYRELATDNHFADRRKPDEVPGLIICGTGSLAAWCEAYIKERHLEHVTLKGGMPPEIVRKLMSRARGVIVPSLWYEGFPMTVAESYAVRTPVIASDLGNLKGLIEENVNGFKFEPGNASALAEAVEKCNPAKLSFDLSDGMEWTKQTNYQKLIKIYEACMGNVWKAEKK